MEDKELSQLIETLGNTINSVRGVNPYTFNDLQVYYSSFLDLYNIDPLAYRDVARNLCDGLQAYLNIFTENNSTFAPLRRAITSYRLYVESIDCNNATWEQRMTQRCAY